MSSCMEIARQPGSSPPYGLRQVGLNPVSLDSEYKKYELYDGAILETKRIG